MKLSEFMRAAKEKISTPQTWCQESYALDLFGCAAEPEDKKAVRWCSAGAIESLRTKDPFNDLLRYQARELLRKAMGNRSIAFFNDRSTHEEVMAVWDRAIQMAEEQEKPMC